MLSFAFAGRSVRSHVTAAIGALAGAALLAVPSVADEIGPAVGAAIPAGLEATDQLGATRTLEDLAGEEGLVLFFVRSADWCPYCIAQLLEATSRESELTTAGYGVAALTTDDAETLAEAAAQKEIGLTLLADPDSEIIEAWGLLDPTYAEGERGYGLPYPATFVVSPEGIVDAKISLEDKYGEQGAYRERVTFDDVVATALAARADS